MFQTNPSFKDRLMTKYPKIFKLDNNDPFSFAGVQCDEGWFSLIDEFCQKINDKVKDEELHITQIKEKFGSLRFYLSSYNEDVLELINEAEEESATTCEICGKHGKIEQVHHYLLKTLCKIHLRKIKNKK